MELIAQEQGAVSAGSAVEGKNRGITGAQHHPRGDAEVQGQSPRGAIRGDDAEQLREFILTNTGQAP